MLESILSQEEIEALLQLDKTDNNGDTKKVRLNFDSPTIKDKPILPGSKATETCRVIFNQIESNNISRSVAEIDDYSDIVLKMQIVLGKTILTVGDILNLKEDSVIVLDRIAGENADLMVNGKPFAQGEIVVLNDCFALRFSHLEEGEGEAKADRLGEAEGGQ